MWIKCGLFNMLNEFASIKIVQIIRTTKNKMKFCLEIDFLCCTNSGKNVLNEYI